MPAAASGRTTRRPAASRAAGPWRNSARARPSRRAGRRRSRSPPRCICLLARKRRRRGFSRRPPAPGERLRSDALPAASRTQTLALLNLRVKSGPSGRGLSENASRARCPPPGAGRRSSQRKCARALSPEKHTPHSKAANTKKCRIRIRSSRPASLCRAHGKNLCLAGSLLRPMQNRDNIIDYQLDFRRLVRDGSSPQAWFLCPFASLR